MNAAGNRRLAVAGAAVAVAVFVVFFAVGRSGREAEVTTGAQAPAIDVSDESADVGAVSESSGSIPSLRPRPERTTGEPATVTTGPSATSVTDTTGPVTTSVDPTNGTGPTSTTGPTTATTGPSTTGPSTTGPSATTD